MLVKPGMRSNFLGGDFSHWLNLNLGGNTFGTDELKLASTWAITFHLLWTWRNKEEHDPNFIRHVLLWSVVYKHLRDYSCAMTSSRQASSRLVSVIDIRWNPPDPGVLCLNSDGAVKGDRRVAGCRGLVRD